MQAGVAETFQALADGIGSEERLAGFLMAAGVALMSLILLRRIWKRGKRGRAGADRGRTGARGKHADDRPASAAVRGRQTLEHVMVEVQELTRLCAAQMENRALRLEKLIREADEKIARLEAMEGDGRGASEDRLGGAGAAPQHTTATRPVGVRSRHEAPERQAERGSLLVDDAIDPVTRRVYGLADQGLTPVEIAGRLEEHVGKVELILALRGH